MIAPDGAALHGLGIEKSPCIVCCHQLAHDYTTSLFRGQRLLLSAFGNPCDGQGAGGGCSARAAAG
jgi:hypothetical protein